MNRSRKSKISPFFPMVFFFLGLFSGPVSADNLNVTPAKILLENLIPGNEYNLTRIANMPFHVSNTSVKGMRIFIEPVAPRPEETEKNFSPLPDNSWFKLSCTNFFLNPGESGDCDMIIRLPEGRETLGRKFEADILTKGFEEGARTRAINFKLEVVSRILFTVVSRTQDSQAAGKKINMNFNLLPQNKFVSNVALGKKIDIKGLLTLENLNEAEYSYAVASVDPEQMLVPYPAGYQKAPAPDILTLSCTNISVGPRMARSVGLSLCFPDTAEYRNKKFMFVVAGQLISNGEAGRKLAKIYVATGSGE